MHVYVHVFAHVCTGTGRGQNKASDPLELQFQALWTTQHGSELRSSGLSSKPS